MWALRSGRVWRPRIESTHRLAEEGHLRFGMLCSVGLMMANFRLWIGSVCSLLIVFFFLGGGFLWIVRPPKQRWHPFLHDLSPRTKDLFSLPLCVGVIKHIKQNPKRKTPEVDWQSGLREVSIPLVHQTVSLWSVASRAKVRVPTSAFRRAHFFQHQVWWCFKAPKQRKSWAQRTKSNPTGTTSLSLHSFKFT